MGRRKILNGTNNIVVKIIIMEMKVEFRGWNALRSLKLCMPSRRIMRRTVAFLIQFSFEL